MKSGGSVAQLCDGCSIGAIEGEVLFARCWTAKEPKGRDGTVRRDDSLVNEERRGAIDVSEALRNVRWDTEKLDGFRNGTADEVYALLVRHR
jgi:hypothetical protein